MKLLFTFHEEDHAKYGSGTWTFDPEVVLRRPVRELIAIEQTIGMGIPGLLLILDRPANPQYTTALLAATWVARRVGGVVEDFDSYEPLVYLMTVKREDSDNPPDGASSSSPESEGA